MAKIHNYTKYVSEPTKVVTVHLSNEEEPDYIMDQCNGCWQAVGSTVETISQNLENSRPGSKFPLFHRIGSETPISRLEVSLFEEELKTIKKELKKLPLTDSRLVSFSKKGKAVVKKLNDEQIDEFKGVYVDEESPKAKNLYDSLFLPIDLHAKMCREAKKLDTGIAWRVVDYKEVKPSKKRNVKIRMPISKPKGRQTKKLTKAAAK